MHLEHGSFQKVSQMTYDNGDAWQHGNSDKRQNVDSKWCAKCLTYSIF